MVFPSRGSLVDAGVSGGPTDVSAYPGLAAVSTFDDLARCLVKLYIHAGMPPFQVLEHESAKTAGSQLAESRLESVRLGRVAINDMLGGRKFPRKAFFLTFVQACGLDLEVDRRWEEAWNRLAPKYLRQVTDQEMDLRQQLAAATARAGQAEASAERIRQQMMAARAWAERAEADNHHLRLAALVRISLEQGAPDADPPQPLPLDSQDPAQIGPFTLMARLSGGVIGKVYLGRSAAGRLVAVKTVKPDEANEPGFRDAFSREIDAARRVSALFTAPVVAADPEADMPWLATAYVPAPTLNQLVRSRGPLPPPTIWWLAAGCMEALASMHDAGLIHGDLKPSNLLVPASGPLIIDFGMARDITRAGLPIPSGAGGTPAYMAPELARDAVQASTASDVFALGATFLFAATGHAPYEGNTIVEVLTRLATQPPDLSGLPTELTGLITGCLARDPQGRLKPEEAMAQIDSRHNAFPPAQEADRRKESNRHSGRAATSS
jgi:hypothetical protein